MRLPQERIVSNTVSPLVSTIIPTFNRRGYVVEAIESALAQSYRPIEVIVIDDGSTDGTAAALAHFGSQIRYIWQPNQGTSVARNHGITASRGELLAFVDSDALWEPDKLTLQVAALTNNPEAHAVLGRLRQFYSPELSAEDRSRLWCPDGIAPGFAPATLLIWRQAFLAVGPFNPENRTAEFMEWMIQADEAALCILKMEACIYRRRIHASNKGIAKSDTFSDRARLIKNALDRRRRASASGEVIA